MITNLFEYYKMHCEKAMDVNDTNNSILIQNISHKFIELCLYDYITKNILGYISASKDKSNYFIIERTSTEKGWGPFMYSLMMQTIYPLGLKPSDKITPSALNVWKNFNTNNNINKTTLDPNDINFADKWLPDVNSEYIIDAVDELKLINTIFVMKQSNWFQPFVMESVNKIKELNIDTKKVFKECKDFFYDKYYVTTESVNIPNKDITDKYLLVDVKGNTIQFLIQNKKDIFAYGELTKDNNYYQIDKISAEPGWGPFLYDTIMLYLDKPIRPDFSLSKSAWQVWDNYLNNRPDVIKTLAKKQIGIIDLDFKERTNPDLVKPINYLYTINNNTRNTYIMDWYNKSLEFSNEMISKLPNWKTLRFNRGKAFHNMKYEANF